MSSFVEKARRGWGGGWGGDIQAAHPQVIQGKSSLHFACNFQASLGFFQKPQAEKDMKIILKSTAPYSNDIHTSFPS
jgi:hypothetical protein